MLLVHAARRTAARSRLRPRAFSHAISLSRSDSTPSPSPSTNKEYPINVIETQQSLRTLASLLRAGNLSSAEQLLADILDATQLSTYRQLTPLLTNNNSPDLLIQLARAAVSRGYSHFTRHDLLPLLPPDLRAQIELELENASSITHTPLPRVFEEPSADYPAPAPPRPTTLDIIHAQLPALLPEPTTHDPALFEDTASAAAPSALDLPPLPSSAHSANTSVGLLDRTLLAGQYEHAYTLLLDMYDLGVPIPPSPKYGYVALALLQSAAPAPLTPAQIDRVAAWLALLPPLTPSTSSSSTTTANQTTQVLSALSAHFLRAHKPDIPTAARLLPVLASRGYAPTHTPRLLDITIRSLGAARIAPFAASIDSALTQHHQQHEYASHTQTPNALARARTAFYNKLVQTLVLSMRADESTPFLTLALSGTWSLSKRTRHLLLGAATRRAPTSPLSLALSALGLSPPTASPSDHTQNTIEPPINFTHSPALGARYLRALLASHPPRTPHSHTIASFIQAYLSIPHPYPHQRRALQLLFARAHAHNAGKGGSARTASSYVLGEMLFYHRTARYELVLETFAAHFYLIGVDASLLLPHIAAHRARRALHPHRYPSRVVLPPSSEGTADANTQTTQRKLFPEAYPRTLLYHALLRCTPHPLRKGIYTSFLSFARAHAAVEAGSARGRRADLGGYTVKSTFGASGFTPFFGGLMLGRGGSPRGAAGGSNNKKQGVDKGTHAIRTGQRILRDMRSLGITPHLHAYTEYARCCARLSVGGGGERGVAEGEREVFVVVRMLEHGAEPTLEATTKATKEDAKEEAAERKTTTHPLPPPDLPFYTAILRAFIQAQNARGAVRIVRRARRMFYPDLGGYGDVADDEVGDNEGEGKARAKAREAKEGEGEGEDAQPRVSPDRTNFRANRAFWEEAVRDLGRLQRELALEGEMGGQE